MVEKLLTPKETAKILQISMATLRVWRKTGKGPPPVRLSRRTIRYSPESIKEYCEQVRPEAWR